MRAPRDSDKISGNYRWDILLLFFLKKEYLKKMIRDTWVTQSVEHPILDFGSGRDLTVREFEPHTGLCADRTEPTWDSLSLPLSASPPLTPSLSK